MLDWVRQETHLGLQSILQQYRPYADHERTFNLTNINCLGSEVIENASVK